MSFPIKHTAYDIKIISTKNRSILITGSLDREKGFFGEFKPNSTPVPDTNNPGTSQFVARYDEKGNLKWNLNSEGCCCCGFQNDRFNFQTLKRLASLVAMGV